MRLIAEAAFEADLRKAHVGVLDQLLGQDYALPANPVLRRESGAALEGAGEMTAREGAGLCQFSDFQAVAEALEDQLFNQPFALRAEAAGAFLWHRREWRGRGILLNVSHGECPCR
ncbi:hypothetical protein D3C73_1306340 [compost metagenome]